MHLNIPMGYINLSSVGELRVYLAIARDFPADYRAPVIICLWPG